jgi:hypothetical protein
MYKMSSLTITRHVFIVENEKLYVYFTTSGNTPTSFDFLFSNQTNVGNDIILNGINVQDINTNGSEWFMSIDPGIGFEPASTYNITFTAYIDSVGVNGTYTYPEGISNGDNGAVCFLGNAPVLTPSGYRRIDSLAVGDLVRTADGRDVAIQRVKHQRVLSPSATVNPYVIPKGTWGATENLAISPRHAVAVPGRGMVEARELGLRQLSMRAAFDYYNLELPEWDNMIVAGVDVESLAPKKRVVMTAAEFRGLVASMGRAVDLAKLARIASVRADGSVDVMLTRKTRRT